jgi:quercetin dioxygenase-like cupin family protein
MAARGNYSTGRSIAVFISTGSSSREPCGGILRALYVRVDSIAHGGQVMKQRLLYLAMCVLLGWVSTVHTQSSPDVGVQPVRLIDRDEVRVSRVELAPGAIRAVHTHTDVLYHLWIPLTENLRLTMGSTVIDTKAGQAYFMAKGTPHGFVNTGQTPAAVMEVFIKAATAGNGH